jgi:hypothetical protein
VDVEAGQQQQCVPLPFLQYHDCLATCIPKDMEAKIKTCEESCLKAKPKGGLEACIAKCVPKEVDDKVVACGQQCRPKEEIQGIGNSCFHYILKLRIF